MHFSNESHSMWIVSRVEKLRIQWVRNVVVTLDLILGEKKSVFSDKVTTSSDLKEFKKWKKIQSTTRLWKNNYFF